MCLWLVSKGGSGAGPTLVRPSALLPAAGVAESPTEDHHTHTGHDGSEEGKPGPQGVVVAGDGDVGMVLGCGVGGGY